jgi:hypothetical protein
VRVPGARSKQCALPPKSRDSLSGFLGAARPEAGRAAPGRGLTGFWCPWQHCLHPRSAQNSGQVTPSLLPATYGQALERRPRAELRRREGRGSKRISLQLRWSRKREVRVYYLELSGVVHKAVLREDPVISFAERIARSRATCPASSCQGAACQARQARPEVEGSTKIAGSSASGKSSWRP